MKDIYLLGATGSIGKQTLDICREHKELFRVVGMSVGRDIELSTSLIEEFKPEIVCLREKINVNFSYNPIIVYGDEGLLEVASYKSKNKGLLVNALVGHVGLKPTIAAIKAHNDVALANKETLVMAGFLVMPLAKEYNVNIFPIDSEHSAIWQCIRGEEKEDIKNLIITASGGSFRDLTREELKNVTKHDALNHPNWSMGAKITIDSATMMNKGFEVIEAHYLFDIPVDNIKTVLHRQSVIHSLVEFNDLSVKAVLSTPDMRMPILYALSYPKHLPYSGKPLDLISISKLTFEELSKDRYKCLQYAYDAIRKGGLYPAVLNAANEAAVNLFLNDEISFLDIEKIISNEISKNYEKNNITIDDIINVDIEIQNRILKNKGAF
ncbi:MAG: 1-deoxy-D-xylulose-5-phosphate reductoisomerase [Anaeroplasmataceae bacterium]